MVVLDYILKFFDYIIYGSMFIFVFISLKIKSKRDFCITALPVLGVIGTFGGIVRGLRGFDSSDITKSIPLLLEGLKTAFWTSLIGISVSLILKIWNSFFKKEGILEDNNTISDLLKNGIFELKKIAELLKGSTLNKEVSEIKNLLNIINISYNENQNKNYNKICDFEKTIEKAILELSNVQNGANSKIENLFFEMNKTKLSDIENFKKIDSSLEILINKYTNTNEELKLQTEKQEVCNLTLSDINDKINILNKKIENESKELVSRIDISTKELVSKVEDSNSLISDNTNEIKNNNSLLNEYSNFSKEQNNILIESFNSFAKHMVEHNNKAFIEALNKSMKELNTQLTEQFGENFKELNKAVGALLDWQNNYKETIEKTTHLQQEIYMKLETAVDGISKFSDEGKTILDISKEFNNILVGIEDQRVQMIKTLAEFSELAVQSKELIPNFKEIQFTVSENLVHFNEEMLKLSQNISEYAKGNSEEMKKYQNEFSKFLEEVTKELYNVIKQLEEDNKEFINLQKEKTRESYDIAIRGIEDLVADIIKKADDINNELKDNIEKYNEETNKIIRDSNDRFQDVLVKGYEASINSLASQLAQLSEKFVNDYEPLTNRLREVLEIASKVNK